MGIGDMLGKAASALGGGDMITDKLAEFGIDPAMLEGMDVDSVKGLLEEKGLDLSMLEGLGISVEDIIAKVTG